MRGAYIRTLLLLCMAAAGREATAQNASRIYVEPNGWSIGVNSGLSDLFGDVGTQSPIVHYTNSNYMSKLAFFGGLFGRYTIHPAMALKLGVNYGALYANDNWNYDLALAATTQGDDGFQRYARAQTARPLIFEGLVMLEISPMRINPESNVSHKRGQPYLTFGAGYFHYTPFSTVAKGTRWVRSDNLSLEGQGFGGTYPEKQKLWQLAVPVGIGYKWDIGEHLNLGFQYCYRMTFTDYLDGVSGKYVDKKEFAKHLSPKDAAIAADMADKSHFKGLSQPQVAGNLRGNPSNNDSYTTLMVTFYYKILTRTHEWWHE